MRLIDADRLLKDHEDHDRISTHVIWNAPTVDAVPVEFIESQIKSAEWTLTHIGNSDYYGNICEELSLKCYILRSLINKWRDEK